MAGSRQEEKKSKNYLPIIWQSILIISFVMGLIYFPVNTKFEAVSKDIEQLKRDHVEHCQANKDRFTTVAETKFVEIQFHHIQESLDGIRQELIACRGSDQKLQDTLQAILIKLK